jgi:hypothetical protein
VTFPPDSKKILIQEKGVLKKVAKKAIFFVERPCFTFAYGFDFQLILK